MDIIGAATDGIGKVMNSAGRELKRVGGEYVENVGKDFDSIAKAIDTGGLLGGAIQAADVFSPGHQTVNHLDAWNVLPEDAALQELVAGGINLATASPWSLVALKDVADAVGAMKGSAVPGPLPPGQGAAAPSPASNGGKGWSGEGQCHEDDGASWSAEDRRHALAEKVRDAKDRALARTQELLARIRGCGGGGEDGADGGTLDADIEKILSNPNLCFEDMIFALMRAFIDNGQDEVRDLAQSLRDSSKSSSREREILQKNVNTARAELDKALQSGDPIAAQRARLTLDGASEKLSTAQAETADSRAQRFEDLKQMMHRLGEMEQALSSVLNTMHETAMATIRNIR